MAQTAVAPAELTEAQFQRISALVKDLCGINLHDGKKELVRARLAKRLRTLGLASFDEYFEFVRGDKSGNELTSMLDVLSTNLTSFFREPAHFEFMVNEALPRCTGVKKGQTRLHIWSAGCSSGEEPYSIAMHLREAAPDLDAWQAGILATDLSTAVLAKAKQGIYPGLRLRDIPTLWLSKYFKMSGTGADKSYQVCSTVRRLVHFARLNLMEPWPMRGPFEVIFCRNVMIYFDKPTQAQLVNRFYDLLAPGGFLFIGHSESLTGIRHNFSYVQPTIYEKT